MRIWHIRITTSKGTFLFPYDGFKTKHEAEAQAELARREPQNIKVEVIKVE